VPDGGASGGAVPPRRGPTIAALAQIDTHTTGGDGAEPPEPPGGTPPREPPQEPAPTGPPRRRIAVNTAIFAFATALSRIAGLAREVAGAAFFGTSAAYSAFTLASQVPNLFSNLFSQAALSAAFVPVFTELLQKGRKREAFRLAATLFWVILVALGGLTLVWFAVADVITPLFTGNGISASLTAGLSRVLFPVVLLLSLTGLLVGI